MYLKKIMIGFILIYNSLNLSAQTRNPVYHIPENEYQFSVSLPFTQPDGKLKASTNYLWIPSNCKQVKAIIISSQNVLEQWLNEHPLLRKVCKENSIAILWSCPGFFIDIKEKSKQVNGKNIQTILDSLAIISGYQEIARIPWISFGHSGTNNLVRELVTNYPGKILTAFTMKGGPGLGNDNRIPVMCSAGEYFEWNQQNEDLIHPLDTIKNYQSVLKERKEKNQPLTYFFDPNTGHFDCSEPLVKLIAGYIDAAVKARIARYNDTMMIPIDLNKGWIAGLPLPGGRLIQPKMYKDAVGDEKNCPWYFNKQQAEDAITLANVNFKRKPQIAGFTKMDESAAGFFKGIVWPIPYTTGEDGVTFTLQPAFLKVIPDTFRFAGTHLGKGKNLPNVVLLCGNAMHIKKNIFKITPERSFKAGATYFVIRTEGDMEFRTCIEPGQLTVTSNDKGLQQTINFNAIKDVTLKDKSIKLIATASSAMPVSFFVKSGPAKIKGDVLIFSKIPPKTKYPIKVTVTAYQWGRNSNPQVQTAPFIEQSFYIQNLLK